ncbi:MAG TPA: uroporphyrinogen decarboxylase family protein [Clostridia bacterium]|nr:uroporphyrinogen decarboxylase family protein [Clostridia bacterium]
MRQPDFKNIVKVLKKQIPDRPTLFEFYINNKTSEILSGMHSHSEWDCPWNYEMNIKAMSMAGYDYITLHGSEFDFPHFPEGQGYPISDEASLRAYAFMDPDKTSYKRLEECAKIMPEKMKVIVFGPGGILENIMMLVGYENMCIMMYEEPLLFKKICDEVGCRMVRYYENCLQYDCVGAIMANDDWGFKTGTMLSPADLRKYIFPYHKKIVEIAHKNDRLAILHSCGNLMDVMDDIIYDMKYDGKHSFEDNIMPVEDAYKAYGNKIAILGGIDLDFIFRQSEDSIRSRCKSLIQLTGFKGYALGTGNSIPDYIPFANFTAMVECAYPEFKNFYSHII